MKAETDEVILEAVDPLTPEETDAVVAQFERAAQAQADRIAAGIAELRTILSGPLGIDELIRLRDIEYEAFGDCETVKLPERWAAAEERAMDELEARDCG